MLRSLPANWVADILWRPQPLCVVDKETIATVGVFEVRHSLISIQVVDDVLWSIMAHRLLIIVALLLQHFHRALCGILAPMTITAPPPGPTNVDLRRHAELDRRITVTPNTCGYTSRNVYYPKTCPIGMGCGWYDGGGAIVDHIVVCVPFDQNGEFNWGAAPLVTTCMHYGQRNMSATALYSETYDSTLFWLVEKPPYSRFMS